MIAIILSILCLIIIVFVTVILINRSLDEEKQRKNDIKSVVDQVNSSNTAASGVEVKQNSYMQSLNTNITTIDTNTANLKKDIAEVQKSMIKPDDLKVYSKKEDLTKEVSTSSISLNSKSSITHNDALAFNMGTGASAKNMAIFNVKDGDVFEKIGGDLTLTKTAKGDNIISTTIPKTKLMIQNEGGPGLIMNGNKVGIGAEPKNATLDVEGSIYAKDGFVSIVNGKLVNIMSTGVSNDGQTMFLNKDGAYPQGVSVTGNVNSTMMGKFAAGIETKGGYSIHNPKNEKTVLGAGTDGVNYIRGDTEIQGNIKVFGGLSMANTDPGVMIEKNYGTDDNRYGIGQYKGGTLRMFAGESFKPANISLSIAKKDGSFNDVLKINTDTTVDINGDVTMKTDKTNRTTFLNPTNKNNKWNIYNNDDNSLVFSQGEFSSSKATGDFNIGKNGNLTTNGNANFKGDIVVGGKVSSTGTLSGQQLCAVNGVNPTCITVEDINGLKLLISQLKAGNTVSKNDLLAINSRLSQLSSSYATKSELLDLQKQITAQVTAQIINKNNTLVPATAPTINPDAKATAILPSGEVRCVLADRQYLIDNPQVANAKLDPWFHYTSLGIKEGRKWRSDLCIR